MECMELHSYCPVNVSNTPLWNIKFLVGMATTEVVCDSSRWAGSLRSVEGGVS